MSPRTPEPPLTLADLEALREGWDFEAKAAQGADGRGAVPHDLWPTYSAMANVRGGRVVLGLREERDGRFVVLGLADPERVERDLWNTLANRQKVSVNLLTEPDVAVRELDGKRLIVLAIPRASRADRPVFLNDDPWSGTYLRVHEGDRKVDRERVRRMMADAEYEVRDDRVLEGSGLEDLDADSVQAYRTVFQNRRPDHPWGPLPERAFLTQLGVLRRDPTSGVEGLTLAGLLMFGTLPAIKGRLPNYMVDYQERATPDALEWRDRIFPDGTWAGNLYGFYRRIIGKLTENLKVPFELDPDLFRRDETHVHEALREALVNCLIHADYEGRVGIRVMKTAASFEFRNPGLPRLAIERIRQGGISDCRNRTVQQLFLMLGVGEQAGSGFARILRAWREQHWQVPTLTPDLELDATVLTLSTASLVPQRTIDELQERFGRAFTELDETARLAVLTARLEERVTNRRLQELSDKHPRDLTFLLGGLVHRGLLVSHGDRGGTWYTLPSAAERSSPQSSTQSSPQSSPQSSTQRSPQSAAQASVDRVARSRWAPRATVEEAILEVCRDGFHSAADLAGRLGRKQVTIQQNYLSPLLQDGRLELRHPENPQHPQQAYRTVSERR